MIYLAGAVILIAMLTIVIGLSDSFNINEPIYDILLVILAATMFIVTLVMGQLYVAVVVMYMIFMAAVTKVGYFRYLY